MAAGIVHNDEGCALEGNDGTMHYVSTVDSTNEGGEV
jgi:hypothetical protein